MNNRHFAVAGTRMVAESFIAHTKEIANTDHGRDQATSLRRLP
jgi:hypothetical protein